MRKRDSGNRYKRRMKHHSTSAFFLLFLTLSFLYTLMETEWEWQRLNCDQYWKGNCIWKHESSACFCQLKRNSVRGHHKRLGKDALLLFFHYRHYEIKSLQLARTGLLFVFFSYIVYEAQKESKLKCTRVARKSTV